MFDITFDSLTIRNVLLSWQKSAVLGTQTLTWPTALVDMLISSDDNLFFLEPKIGCFTHGKVAAQLGSRIWKPPGGTALDDGHPLGPRIKEGGQLGW